MYLSKFIYGKILLVASLLAGAMLTACSSSDDEPTDALAETEPQTGKTILNVNVSLTPLSSTEGTNAVTTAEECTLHDLHVLLFTNYGSLMDRRDIYPADGQDALTEADLNVAFDFDWERNAEIGALFSGDNLYYIYAFANVGHLTDNTVAEPGCQKNNYVDYNNVKNLKYVTKHSGIKIPNETDYQHYDEFLTYSRLMEQLEKIPDDGLFDADNLPMVSDLTKLDFSEKSTVDVTLHFALTKCVFTLLFDTAESGYSVRPYNQDERNQTPPEHCFELYNIMDTFYLVEGEYDGIGGGCLYMGLMSIPWQFYPDYTTDEEQMGDTEGYYAQPVGEPTTFDQLPDPHHYMARYICYLPERYWSSVGGTKLALAFKRFDASGNEGDDYFTTDEIPASGENLERGICYEMVYKVSGKGNIFSLQSASAPKRGLTIIQKRDF